MPICRRPSPVPGESNCSPARFRLKLLYQLVSSIRSCCTLAGASPSDPKSDLFDSTTIEKSLVYLHKLALRYLQHDNLTPRLSRFLSEDVGSAAVTMQQTRF